MKCTAHRTDGAPCQSWAIKGGTVCRSHGGSAPQVRRAATERLQEARDKALELVVGYIDSRKMDPSTALAAVDKITKLVELLEGRATNRTSTETSEVDRELKATLAEWERQLQHEA